MASPMRCCEILETNASCFPLRQNGTDTHIRGGAPNLRLLQAYGPAIFMRRDRYIAVLSQLTGLSTVDSKQKLICSDGLVPMLRLGYFD